MIAGCAVSGGAAQALFARNVFSIVDIYSSLLQGVI
jgi:hypothetical protein